MADDRLGVLRALRRREVEAARYALAACLRTEAEIKESIGRIDFEAQRDRAAESHVAESHRFVEMFTLRQRARHQERRAREEDLMGARARSAEAVGALTGVRTAAEAVETLIAERDASAAADANRREQHALDDIARFQHGGQFLETHENLPPRQPHSAR